MKKYKLLKDIPGYSAGTEARLSDKGHLCVGDTVLYYKGQLKNNPVILEEWFEEIPEKLKLSGQFIPEFGGGMFYPTCHFPSGKIIPDHSGPYRPTFAHILAKVGCSFENETDCERWIKRQEAIQAIRRDTKGFKPDWKDGRSKWEVVYEHSSANYDGIGLFVNEVHHCQCNCDLYFRSLKDAEESIKNHPQEWLIYLGIEDAE